MLSIFKKKPRPILHVKLLTSESFESIQHIKKNVEKAVNGEYIILISYDVELEVINGKHPIKKTRHT